MNDVPDLRGGHRATASFVLGPLLGALVVVASVLWSAAKYPERSEFEAVKAKIESTAMDTAIHKVRLDGVQTRLDSIEVKIDRLLDESRPKGRNAR